jgi:beta-glucosidase
MATQRVRPGHSPENRRRAVEIVARMTLDEKVSQMLFDAPAIPRLGIPAYNWWNEALHGVARAGTATVFPQAIALAATFDESLLRRIADAISTEARAKHHESVRRGDRGIYKGLTFWSPNVNIFRDPRWGRGHETYGEDPWLTARLGCAFVLGLQGEDPRYLKTAACAKHFAVHSGPEGERHTFDARVSEKDLWETYLPAFRALVTESGVEAVMGAYNRTNGEPCCGSPRLLTEILRGDWGFDGHVTSDCWALQDFHMGHGVTKTAPESAALAVRSGCDLNCGSLFGNLLVAVEEGLVDEKTVDAAVVRLMTTRLRLGMFESESAVPYARTPYSVVDAPEHRALALEASARSLVLLKNERSLLPLSRERIATLAVIGPNADNREMLLGNYAGTPSRTTTLLEGIQQAVAPGTRVLYAEGCHLWKKRPDPLAHEGHRLQEAVSAAESADVVVLCLGIDPTMEGEQFDSADGYGDGDRPDLRLPGLQQRLLEDVVATGKPVVLVHASGSAVDLRWADEHVASIVQIFYPGAEGGQAVADLLFGRSSPSGRLPVTFYRTSEELPDFHDYAMTGRTYRYMTNEALYPFGFGLGYGQPGYSAPCAEPGNVPAGATVRCSATVTNPCATDCLETVQLYLSVEGAPEPAPRWSLKGVRVVSLKAGETKEVSFDLGPDEMAVYDGQGRRTVETGRHVFHIGGTQPDACSVRRTGVRPVSASFVVEGPAQRLPR